MLVFRKILRRYNKTTPFQILPIKLLWNIEETICTVLFLAKWKAALLTLFSMRITLPSSWSSKPFIVTVKSMIEVLALIYNPNHKVSKNYWLICQKSEHMVCVDKFSRKKDIFLQINCYKLRVWCHSKMDLLHMWFKQNNFFKLAKNSLNCDISTQKFIFWRVSHLVRMFAWTLS